jgi:hypothetical protein
MTLDETRDEIAKAIGWIARKHRGGLIVWTRGEVETGDHPVPATLDAIAALWPMSKPFRLDFHEPTTGRRMWRAFSGNRTADAHTELEARAALLLAVLRHEKEAKKS